MFPAGALKNLKIDRVTVVDAGGSGLTNAATAKVNASIAALEQVAGAMGLDLDSFIKRLPRFGARPDEVEAHEVGSKQKSIALGPHATHVRSGASPPGADSAPAG